MRLVSYYYRDELEWGVWTEKESVLRARDLEEYFFIPLPESLTDLILAGREGMLLLASALTRAQEESVSFTELQPAEIEIALPFQPQRIICVGRNYAAHVAEFQRHQGATAPPPDAPVYFTKSTTSLAPSEATLHVADLTDCLDYEGELAVIIGKDGSRIPAEQAGEYIFGYTALNDLTARDIQKERGQWYLGKSLPGCCPLGPTVLVGAREDAFTVRTYVNDELRQEATTAELIHAIPALIADLSRYQELRAGDIISTGTPAGCGIAFEPPRYLQAGDTVHVCIDEIGTLTTRIG
ncbi:MAG: fumarylacetoacetate hydrolase family protein [Veillonellaceae bacterium]|nr:fumarylacetoacetate hydrolase family protein [Veillonellaceae bacterium]